MSNYFGDYSSREEYIANLWIGKFNRGNAKNIYYEKDNTSYHDGILFFTIDGKKHKVTIQIKEEEYYWYGKTGNLGFDFLSAFYFKADRGQDLIELRKKYFEDKKNRVRKDEIKYFLKNDITVSKYGKLLTCDADLHIFYVEDNDRKIIISNAYSNYYLQSFNFMQYVLSKYDLRINKKTAYGIDDNRESAAFFIKPSDPYIKKSEISNIENIIEIIEKREVLKGYKFDINNYINT